MSPLTHRDFPLSERGYPMRSQQLAQTPALRAKPANVIALKNAKPASGKDRALWLQTASGAPFDLAAQNEEQVSINDIAAHLSKICRFAGATTQFYSVAQHSVLVSQALKKYGPM